MDLNNCSMTSLRLTLFSNSTIPFKRISSLLTILQFWFSNFLHVTSCRMTGRRMSGCRMTGRRMSGCHMSGRRMLGCRMSGRCMSGCRMSGRLCRDAACRDAACRAAACRDVACRDAACRDAACRAAACRETLHVGMPHVGTPHVEMPLVGTTHVGTPHVGTTHAYCLSHYVPPLIKINSPAAFAAPAASTAWTVSDGVWRCLAVQPSTVHTVRVVRWRRDAMSSDHLRNEQISGVISVQIFFPETTEPTQSH